MKKKEEETRRDSSSVDVRAESVARAAETSSSNPSICSYSSNRCRAQCGKRKKKRIDVNLPLLAGADGFTPVSSGTSKPSAVGF